jgi:hypothetical protein
MNLLDDPDQIGGIGQVAVMHEKTDVFLMRVPVEMIHPGGVERRGSAFDPVDFIAFFEKKFSQVGTVLACQTGNERFFHVWFRRRKGKRVDLSGRYEQSAYLWKGIWFIRE